MQTTSDIAITQPPTGMPLSGSVSTSQEWAVVEENNRITQGLIQLCPRFLTSELKMASYDNNLTLLEMPVFKTPVRRIKDDASKEGRIDLLKAGIMKIEATLKPAEPDQLKEQLGKLMLHKGFGNYNEGQWTAVLKDYMRLLGRYPYDLICKACDECICDPDMVYFPQVGRIKQKMDKEITIRCLYLERLRKILECSEGQEMRQEEPRAKELGAMLAARFRSN